MNTTEIYKVFRHNFKNLRIQIPTLLGSFVLGIVLVYIIVRLTSSDTYANIGIFISSMFFSFVTIGMLISSFVVDYKNIVKLSINRKSCLIGSMAYYFISILVASALTPMLARLEIYINSNLYKNIKLEMLFERVYTGNPYISFIVGLLVMVAGIICSAVVLKFGLIGFTIIYFLFIFGSTLFGSSIVRDTLSKLSGNPIISTITGIPLVFKVIAISAIIIILLAICFKVIMKAEVT